MKKIYDVSRFSRAISYLVTHPGILEDVNTGELYRPVITGHEGPIPEEITLEPLYDTGGTKPVVVRDFETLKRYQLIEVSL